jgi:hypothetical protein
MFGCIARIDVLPTPSKLVVRVVISTTLVLCGLYAIERPVGALLSPLFQREIEMLAPAFAIRSSYNGQEKVGQWIRFDVYLAGNVHLAGHVLAPFVTPGADPRSVLEIRLPFSDVFKYCPLTLILVLAWPAKGVKELLWRCAVAMPLMVILVLIDVPSVVISNIWNEVRNELGVHGVSGWVLFRRCLSGGGGLVLGCFMAGVAIGAARRFTAERRVVTPLSEGDVLMGATADSPKASSVPSAA